MEKLVEVVKQQMDEEFNKQKEMLKEQSDLKRALSSLDSRYKNILSTIKQLESGDIPSDLLSWYIKTKGTLWISKRKIVNGYAGELHLNINGYDLTYGNDINIPKGLYRFVVIPISQEISVGKDNVLTDDFGSQTILEGKLNGV